MTNIRKLNDVLTNVKRNFVEKNEIVDLLGIGLLAGENAFLYGPPGTAKSAIVRYLSQHIEDGNNFEYLLTRFTEPSEIFGPFDIRKLKEGELLTNTDGMLPEASLIFLDEIFNANSAILNSLLMALNEKIYRRGKETKKLPALIFVGASNIIPEEETLAALFDRFLIRIKNDYVSPDKLNELLSAGWLLESQENQPLIKIKASELKELQKECKKVNLLPIRNEYVDLIHSMRNAGLKISDRRAIKIQNLIAASALICERNTALLSDLWVLKYVWDNVEQIEIIESIVNTKIQNAIEENIHPQALKNNAPNPEALLSEIRNLAQQWINSDTTLEQRNIIKDGLRYLQTRCDWVKNQEQRNFIQLEIDELWKNMLQTV